jgi:hypothetical protein
MIYALHFIPDDLCFCLTKKKLVYSNHHYAVSLPKPDAMIRSEFYV